MSLQDLAHVIVPNNDLSAAIIAICILLVYCIFVYYGIAKEPNKGTIIAASSPPEHISPSGIRYISQMEFDSNAFLVALQNMTAKGFLQISLDRGIYTLTKLVEEDGKLLSFGESMLARELFADSNQVVISSDNVNHLENARNTLNDALVKEFRGMSYSNHFKFMIFPVLLVYFYLASSLPLGWVKYFVALVIMLLQYYCAQIFHFLAMKNHKLSHGYAEWSEHQIIQREDNASIPQMISLILTYGSSCLVCLALPGNKKNISDISPQNIFEEEESAKHYAPAILAIVVSVLPLFFFFNALTAGLYIIMMFILTLFSHKIRSHTLQARRFLDKVEGFKLFIKSANMKQLTQLFPNQTSDDIFIKYFPYALALDAGDEWAKACGGQEKYLEFYDGYSNAILSIIEET